MVAAACLSERGLYPERMALTIVLNGLRQSFPELAASATVGELVAVLGLKADRIAIERNGQIAARALWGTLAVVDGDRLEVVHFVGGGATEDGYGGHPGLIPVASAMPEMKLTARKDSF